MNPLKPPSVNGKTRLLGLFGYPVKHSISPAMHNAAFSALKLNLVYLPFEVSPQNLGDAVKAVRALHCVGVNVTVPHKQEVIPFLDGISTEARLIGAVNTIKLEDKRLVGYNTDGRGFIRFLQEEARFDLKDKKMVLIGSGGAGRAVAVQAALEKVAQITLADMDAGRARTLADLVRAKIPPCKAQAFDVGDQAFKDALAEADLVVDATPLGMHSSDPVSVDAALFSKRSVVVDLVYNPPMTKLLKAAKRRGCRVHNGLGMLFYQGAIAFEIWMGRQAPVEVMRKALKKAMS